LGDVESASQIHPHDALEFFQRQVLDGAVSNDPGVIDQDVEPAEFFADRFHHCRDVIGLGDIAVDDERIFQSLSDRFRIPLVLTFCVADVIDDALRAAPAERFDHFRPQSARAAGDEDDFG